MDVFQLVTERIVNELEHGVIPWRKPWVSLNCGAYNCITGRRYGTLNQMLLLHDGPYASLQQWNRLGGTVKKGSVSETVTFWKVPEEDAETEPEKTSDETREKKRPVLRYYRVFHISQVAGIKEQDIIPGTMEFNLHADAEQVFQNYLEFEDVILEQAVSDRAYYSPEKDLIHLPARSQFQDQSLYYSTVFHEACHSTGHAKRIGRAGVLRPDFGSERYSKEELIAEIGAACMLRTLGIDTTESINNSAAYIDGWLSAIRDNRFMVAAAAGQAEKAVRFILDCSKFQERNNV